METLTDWSKSPLDEDQIRYAADDARVLFPLYRALSQKYKTEDLETYMWQACEEMVEQQASTSSSRIELDSLGRVAETLTIGCTTSSNSLLEWRTADCDAENQSPNYILPRSILLYLAKAHPTTVEKIQNRKVHPHFSTAIR